MTRAIRRLGTLAGLTLIWLLASATSASAHCHGTITYGPGGSGDCGKSALWGTLLTAAAWAAAWITVLLLPWLKIEREWKSILQDVITPEYLPRRRLLRKRDPLLYYSNVESIAKIAREFGCLASIAGGPRWLGSVAELIGIATAARVALRFRFIWFKHVIKRIWHGG